MSEQVTLRSIGVGVYLPTMLYGVGQGAMVPIIAHSARDLGASVGVAGLVVAAIGVGQLIGDLPAGALAGRIGERRAMLAAAALDVVAMAACVIAGSVWLLGAAIFCAGLAGAVWGLARQAYLAEVVPFHLRARAMSTLGGVHRIGRFIGPFLGAGVVRAWGTDGAYAMNGIAVLAAAALLVSLPEPQGRHPHATTASGDVRIVDVARSHLPIFYTLGVGVLLIGAVRASRDVVLPLWADSLGFDAATTSLIFGIAGAVDMLLFYPAGKVMDRVGRAFVAVPSMVVLAAAHFLLPLTHDLTSLSLVALLMGFGNGIGSGIVMTLGADLSPSVGRPAFLGAWRLCADAGNSGGPLLIGTVSAAVALGPAIVLMGGLGLLGALVMGRYIPRYVPSPRSLPSVVEEDQAVLRPGRTRPT
ncbi:MFS transporter [Thermasporomyces composti]|jgi:MFS family permease|uniref:Putative MFS family arabinose efflux permease n=1 Tax=Thermasporomyces composti TaxID=696763 RepID=A0A3D9VE63_THECX|nr:MFS transporter [Thermasporomyces composti]REF37385.1 putative MFS family arabinose efflux permease [Thermasporomyces composti]